MCMGVSVYIYVLVTNWCLVIILLSLTVRSWLLCQDIELRMRMGVSMCVSLYGAVSVTVLYFVLSLCGCVHLSSSKSTFYR